jgi:hypothetical protein
MANITYRQVGDYIISNLRLPPEESAIRLGKWGMLHKDYLQKHNPLLFATLLTQGTLYKHCAEIETNAQQMFNTLVEQMKIAEGVTEALKEENQMERVRRMQNIESQAREIVCHDIIFK